MSVTTWREEYMPVEAEDTAKEDALGHGLRKWVGMTWAAMDRHNVVFCNGQLQNITEDDDDDDPCNDPIDIDSSTCALCAAYYSSTPDGDSACEECPLTQIRGVPCDSTEDERLETAPYVHFSQTGDPQPMIELIMKAVVARLAGLEAENKLLSKRPVKKADKKPARKR